MKRLSLIAALALGMAFAAGVQAITVGYNPRTGDIWLDTELNDINRYGYAYGDYFVDEVVVAYGAPRTVVYELYHQRHWQPADIYYACALASLLQRPCLEVANIYERDSGQGWGVVAQRLGIKPGSEDFHRLKGQTGASSAKFKVYDEGPNGKNKSGKSGNGAAKSASAGANANSDSKPATDGPGNSENAPGKDKGNNEKQDDHGNSQSHGNSKNHDEGHSSGKSQGKSGDKDGE